YSEFEIEAYHPKADGVATFTVAPGTFHVQLTEANVAATVVVKGELYSSDIQHTTGKDFAIKTIKTLDLREATIVAQGGYAANEINHPFFVYPNGMSTPASVIENILLPDNVVCIAGGVFKNCAKIKEITLPADLRSVPVKPAGSNVFRYGLATDAFLGCTNLATIRIPGAPGEYNGRKIVAHHNPYSTTNSFWYQYYNLGHEDPKKVTVIVPEEYLSVYTTAYNETTYGNPWKGHGYNILSEYPVYGVTYDQTRIVADADLDLQKTASFLMDNVELESVTVEGKLRLANPDVKCRVFDNGKEIALAEDGTIPVTFYNPAKNPELSGNHHFEVVNFYDVTFASSSPLFTVTEPVVENENGYNDAEFNTTEAGPVLSGVAENSTVRFGVGFDPAHV
ncbi:MAG: leucine-rich repeat domain-containing protein, partial [Allobaculum sp.]|nr:leucine-rich repeat domain-containing protein [Allobaculum sp.]